MRLARTASILLVLLAVLTASSALRLRLDRSDLDWSTLSPSSIPRTEAAVAVYDNKLYVLAGFTRNVTATHLSEVYDPDIDRWSELAPIPVPVTHMGTALVDGQVWVVGGFEGNHPGPATNITQIYDIKDDSWSNGPPLPVKRASGTLALLGRRLHHFGGLLPDRDTDTGDHFVLDLDRMQDGWVRAADLPHARNHLSSAVFEGRIYAIAGQVGHDGGRAFTKRMHIYDPATDTWERSKDLPVRMSHAEGSTFVYDGRIFVAGGVGPGSALDASLDLISVYDPVTNRWSEYGTLPTDMLGGEVRVIGQRLIAANGSIGVSGNAQSHAFWAPVDAPGPDQLGCHPASLSGRVEQGSRVTLETIVWTHSEMAAYEVDAASLPDWLSVSDASRPTASPNGAPLLLDVDAEKLVPGLHTAELTISAPNYPPARLGISVEVVPATPREKEESTKQAGTAVVDPIFPNPFHSSSLISYSVDRTSHVRITLYNIRGDRLAELHDGPVAPGRYALRLDGTALANGIYLIVLDIGGRRFVQRAVLAR